MLDKRPSTLEISLPSSPLLAKAAGPAIVHGYPPAIVSISEDLSGDSELVWGAGEGWRQPDQLGKRGKDKEESVRWSRQAQRGAPAACCSQVVMRAVGHHLGDCWVFRLAAPTPGRLDQNLHFTDPWVL